MVANSLRLARDALEKRNERWRTELRLVERLDPMSSGHLPTAELDQFKLEAHFASSSLSVTAKSVPQNQNIAAARLVELETHPGSTHVRFANAQLYTALYSRVSCARTVLC